MLSDHGLWGADRKRLFPTSEMTAAPDEEESLEKRSIDPVNKHPVRHFLRTTHPKPM